MAEAQSVTFSDDLLKAAGEFAFAFGLLDWAFKVHVPRLLGLPDKDTWEMLGENPTFGRLRKAIFLLLRHKLSDKDLLDKLDALNRDLCELTTFRNNLFHSGWIPLQPGLNPESEVMKLETKAKRSQLEKYHLTAETVQAKRELTELCFRRFFLLVMVVENAPPASESG